VLNLIVQNNILCILNEKNPVKVKKYGRMVKNYNDVFWKNRRYTVMMDALYYKFNQNDNIKKKLIQTNNKQLYEATKNDRIWGIGFSLKDITNIDKNRYGKNLLGKALMEFRNNELII